MACNVGIPHQVGALDDDAMHSVVGTPQFSAPEVLQGAEPYGFKVWFARPLQSDLAKPALSLRFETLDLLFLRLMCGA